VLCAGLVTAAGALAGCASESHRDPGGSTATVTASPSSQPTSSQPSTAPPSSQPEPTSSSPVEGATFTMPNEVGKGLQDAQDDLQRVSHDPVFYTSSKDATGRGRHQVFDRDWKVCGQNVPAGKLVERKTVLITFSVVKLAESCP